MHSQTKDQRCHSTGQCEHLGAGPQYCHKARDSPADISCQGRKQQPRKFWEIMHTQHQQHDDSKKLRYGHPLTEWENHEQDKLKCSSICSTSCQTCAQCVDHPWVQKWQGKRVVQKLVACGFNVPPDELQNREWFWLSRWTVLKAEEQEGQAGVEKRGSSSLSPILQGLLS